jgi:hypothetical protein
MYLVPTYLDFEKKISELEQSTFFLGEASVCEIGSKTN